jgi:hypothetical protein
MSETLAPVGAHPFLKDLIMPLKPMITKKIPPIPVKILFVILPLFENQTTCPDAIEEMR